MENLIIIIILIAIVTAIIWYLVREKRNGAACIGCPHSKLCCGGCGNKKSDNRD